MTPPPVGGFAERTRVVQHSRPLGGPTGGGVNHPWRGPAWLDAAVVAMAIAMAGTAWSAESKAFHYDSHGRRDPFEPLVTPTGEARTPRSGGVTGTLHVEGILWDPTKPLAIVNGEVRRVGDEVEGYRIAEIRKNAIVVDGNDADHLIVPVLVEGAGSATP